jgi:hypothetical protein
MATRSASASIATARTGPDARTSKCHRYGADSQLQPTTSPGPRLSIGVGGHPGSRASSATPPAEDHEEPVGRRSLPAEQGPIRERRDVAVARQRFEAHVIEVAEQRRLVHEPCDVLDAHVPSAPAAYAAGATSVAATPSAATGTWGITTTGHAA